MDSYGFLWRGLWVLWLAVARMTGINQTPSNKLAFLTLITLWSVSGAWSTSHNYIHCMEAQGFVN